MTKKDYELIASAIKEQWFANTLYGKSKKDIEGGWFVHLTALRISQKLKDDNPRFDRDKFLQACGIED